ncbi:MAG TPA: SRPBCC domain-containing protein [Pirellulaceae bacterium]|nr:SRPBCC domain-containing protein [Pirellulaceae bacterium]HMO92130.1 SRPBCC domain-containing protein [Pirellulaceae bacterium]HMP69282.1 SRPBCC domain-containing protein [Pirellulaceae bacterium]
MKPSQQIAEKQIYRVVIEAPIDKVWATFTKSGEVLPFFFGSVLHTTSLAPGAPVRMRTPNGKHTGVVGEVLEFDPPHRYSHTFKFTQLDDPLCIVTYELKSIEGGTEFTLTTTQVPKGTKTEKQMAGGGKIIVSALKHYVETGRYGWVPTCIVWMGKLMGPFTPRKCRSELWPLDKKIE